MKIKINARSHAKLTIIFLFLSMIWGSDFVMIKFGLTGSNPLIFAGLRYFLAGVVLLLVLIACRRGYFQLLGLREILIPVFLGILATMEFGFLYFGMKYVSAGIASILFNTQPIMVSVLATMFLKESVTWKKAFAIGFGFIGVVLIFGENLSNGLTSPGGFLVLLGALSWAVGTIMFKKLVRNENLLWVSSVLLLTSGAFLFVISFLFGEAPSLVITFKLALVILYLATVCSAFGIAVWFYLLKHYDASQVSPYLFLVPAFGVLLGWLLLGETVYFYEVIGIFFVGMSIYILNK
ncbi:MAG: DMT family transporter [Bacteroidales bacterium]